MLIEQLNTLLNREATFYKYVCIALCVFCVVFLAFALYKFIRRSWDSLYYTLICFAFLLWSLYAVGSQVVFSDSLMRFLSISQQITTMFVPALLCLHIWKQVSYRNISFGSFITILIVPIALSVLAVIRLKNPQVGQEWNEIVPMLIKALFYLYGVGAFVKASLLCLNVFYQMPRHMRKSTYILLAGIFFTGLYMVAKVFYDGPFIDMVCAASAFVAMASMFNALTVASSSEVIATSREFVFSNLSTVVFVANKNMQILDWNKKSTGTIGVLPIPKYKELFSQYRERIIKNGDGRVSVHVDNVISANFNGTEYNFLITAHEIKYKNRLYGYTIEISEITKLYTTLRYFEEIALRDYLTDLYSRNAYFDAVQRIRVAENMPLAVIVGDVNRLKETNDIKGHLAGDALLKAVAGVIKQCSPSNGYAYRIGGDEFVILIPNEREETAKNVIARINNTCPSIYDELYGEASVTWGYAIMHAESEDYNDVFKAADLMMYEEKKKQNRVFRSSGLVPENLLAKASAEEDEVSVETADE